MRTGSKCNQLVAFVRVHRAARVWQTFLEAGAFRWRRCLYTVLQSQHNNHLLFRFQVEYTLWHSPVEHVPLVGERNGFSWR